MSLPADARTYLSALQRALRPLPLEERQPIVSEIESHLADRAAQGALAAAIFALGAPEILATTDLEDRAVRRALANPAPFRLLLGVLTRSGRNLLAITDGFIALVFYAIALAFALMAVLKPFTPQNVGFWTGGGGINFGAVFGQPIPADERLGYCIIPIAIAGGVAAYMAATLLLRRAGRMLLRRSQTFEDRGWI
jgi:uncharacterized membrane protein